MLKRRSYTLHEQRDMDILDWLNKQPNESGAVRTALRYYINADATQPSNEQFLNELRQVVSEIFGGLTKITNDKIKSNKVSNLSKKMNELIE